MFYKIIERIYMGVMIACSPSTGSSLLRRILSRHPAIFCGSETSLLSKKSLYTDWNSNKAKILSSSRFKLKDSAWHHFRGILIDEEYNLDPVDVDKMVLSSKSFSEFIDRFFRLVLNNNKKELWVEKTPSNAFTASDFLDNFNEDKLIHIVRNPYDAISSLVNRGMSVYNASSVYLLNTSKVLDLIDHPRHILIKYEALVDDTEQCLKQLMQFLELDYSDSLLDINNQQKGVTKMQGWNYEETGEIGKRSLSRFEKMNEGLKQEIIFTGYSIKSKLKTKVRSIKDICGVLDYDFLLIPSNKRNMAELRLKRIVNILSRTMKLRYFNACNYPIEIDD